MERGKWLLVSLGVMDVVIYVFAQYILYILKKMNMQIIFCEVKEMVDVMEMCGGETAFHCGILMGS